MALELNKRFAKYPTNTTHVGSLQISSLFCGSLPAFLFVAKFQTQSLIQLFRNWGN
eukprot:m.160214 g.160214  ORF g.160214 m.160214 type:complete len:56 (-) comp31174_c0_seq2:144-311(-)